MPKFKQYFTVIHRSPEQAAAGRGRQLTIHCKKKWPILRRKLLVKCCRTHFRNLDNGKNFKNGHSVVRKGRNKTNTPFQKARLSVIDRTFRKEKKILRRGIEPATLIEWARRSRPLHHRTNAALVPNNLYTTWMPTLRVPYIGVY